MKGTEVPDAAVEAVVKETFSPTMLEKEGAPAGDGRDVAAGSLDGHPRP